LPTRIAMTESVSWCADEKLTAFLELESAIPFQKLEAQRSTVAERCV